MFICGCWEDMDSRRCHLRGRDAKMGVSPSEWRKREICSAVPSIFLLCLSSSSPESMGAWGQIMTLQMCKYSRNSITQRLQNSGGEELLLPCFRKLWDPFIPWKLPVSFHSLETQSLNLWLCGKQFGSGKHYQQTLLCRDAGIGYYCHSPAACKHLVSTIVAFGFLPS